MPTWYWVPDSTDQLCNYAMSTSRGCLRCKYESFITFHMSCPQLLPQPITNILPLYASSFTPWMYLISLLYAVYMMAFLAPAAGKCPALDPSDPAVCITECDEDEDCDGSAKCCSSGCGKICVQPELPGRRFAGSLPATICIYLFYVSSRASCSRT